MVKVTFAENPMDVSSWRVIETTGTVTDALREYGLKEMPATARIYYDTVDAPHDVTPFDDDSVAELEAMTGSFYVVWLPNGPLALVIVAIALAAVSIGLTFLLRPNTKLNNGSQSPNNSLSDRQNQARPNERIPDIYGTVRSTPDEIMQPYKIFESNIEVEHGFLCIGRGDYTVLDCKDELTDIADIDGAYAAVFGPNTSPNSPTYAPKSTFGTAPASIPKVISIQPSSAIVGQVLRAPNSGSLNTNNNVGAAYPDQITNDGSISFLDYFAVGTPTVPNYLTIADDSLFSDPAGSVHSVSLGGTYEILDVTENTITLSSPSAVNSNWSVINTFSGGISTFAHKFNISTTGTPWVGPFDLQITCDAVYLNVVGPNGLYYIDSDGNQHALIVTIEAGIQAIDVNGSPVGDEITASVNVNGSAVLRNQVGSTLKVILPSASAIRVRMNRITNIGTDTNNQYVEEIQWRDMFAVQNVNVTDWGNVTTVQTITIPTQDALSVKERKLNLLVTRNIPTWNNRAPGFVLVSGQTSPTFSTTLYPSNNAADIICAMSLDPFIGRRTIAELDVQQIYSVADSTGVVTPGVTREAGAIQTYFDTPLMTEFCYTFDDYKVSFEESLFDVCQAIGCTAYRQGSQLYLKFEQKTSDARLLFNHRNKLPGSETRTVSFGTLNDNDGITFDYIDPEAPNYPNQETTLTLYFPPDQSAANPKQVTSVGIRNRLQAQLIGYRMYQKLINQNTQTEFTGLAECALIPEMESILISDNTRPDVQDGEILRVDGLTCITSQPVVMVSGKTYTAFLQLPTGQVQAIACTLGPPPADGRSGCIILSGAPSTPLIAQDAGKVVSATYEIVASDDSQSRQFLLQQKDPGDDNTFKITALNYSDDYYLHDPDVANGIIIPPLIGYGPQGFTGYGNLKEDLTPYTGPPLSGYSLSSYTGSSLALSQQVASPQTHSVGPPYASTSGEIDAADVTGLAPVALTGAATDLTGMLPVAKVAGLSSVATLGTYSSLTGTPTIPPPQVNSDWNATSGVAQILNKPALTRFAGSIRTITTSSSITTSDYTVKVDATSGALSITLPTPTDSQVINVKKIDASANTVTVTGAIDGMSSLVLNAQWVNYTLQYDPSTATWSLI